MSVRPRRATARATVIALTVLVLLLLLAGVYGWRRQAAQAARAGQVERVVIATNTEYVGSCPVTEARRQGYFSDEGIQAQIQSHSSGKAAMDAVLQGKADMGTVADIPVMFAGLNKDPVAVIATIFDTEKDHGIVGRRDRGVDGAASLKGKRIGVTLNTSGHFMLDAFLNRQRLAPSEVSMRNYLPEELPDALARGEVDAIATWEPFLAASLRQQGGNGVAFYGQDVYESIYNVAAMRAYIAAHPETIRKILRALRRGAQYCAAAPVALPTYHFRVVLDQGLILALEDEARWAIKNRMSERADMPNYLDYMYLDGLETVRPSAVTIIH
ncbi:MAG TPA: nitrate ABC transporter substrate-binding protein [Janthinobacterium sp.]|nr:nitrate ABC transporter substrate-binding protein [Janthinobacterium sp.]